jgi:hypothetical protein
VPKFTLEEIQDMLDALPMKEWRFDQTREDSATRTGALRTTKGQNIVEPSTESQSMIVGLRPSIDFLENAPEIVQQLLDTLGGNAKGAEVDAPPDVASTPISA